MPKLGRRSEGQQMIDYLYGGKSLVTKNAPFGTGDTPQQRMKIIGGKPVLMKEDGNYGTPRWALSPEPVSSPKKERVSVTPSKIVAPLAEKPTNFNPAGLSLQAKNFYSSAQKDHYRSHVHSPEANNPINPHKVLPPIGTPSTSNTSHSHPAHLPPQFRPAQSPQQKQLQNTSNKPSQNQDEMEIWERIQKNTQASKPETDLLKHLPTDGSYLPGKPIKLSKAEELELRRGVREDLEGFDKTRLRDLYMKLVTTLDQQLTGYVQYADLGTVLVNARVYISALNLRLIASMYLSENEHGRVNYEKVLTFIAAAMKNDNADSSLQNPPDSPASEGPKRHSPSKANTGIYFNPITHEQEDRRRPEVPPSPRSKRFPYGDRDNAKLLRMIENAIISSNEELDFDKIWTTFRQADRAHRDMLSREQIKTLSYASQIPLQESLLDHIIDKVDASNGQYSWVQFLEFIEKVQPMKTGLRIPPSKRPTDYVKHYPEPSADWPQVNEDLLPKSNRNSVVTPYVNPNNEMPLSHPRQERLQELQEKHKRQDANDNVQKQLQQLEQQYQTQRKNLMQAEQQTKQGLEPWFDRYLKLANALYRNDTDNEGHLSTSETRWLTTEYNDVYQLGLPEDKIHDAIRKTEDNDHVHIDTFLKCLRLQVE